MPEYAKAFEEVRAQVEGPLGEELEKYPLKFAAAAFFGARPQPGTPMIVNSGSASLLRLEGQPFALTCWHVIESFRESLKKGPCIFQLANCELDPLAQLKAQDKGLDYALIVLTEDQAKEIAKPDGPFDGTFFAEPQKWPPADVKQGQFVAFGGFPGELREAVSLDEISFGSFSSGASRVTSVGEDYLVCQFEREYWIKHGYEAEPKTIRGMSGGPVFAIRHNGSGIMFHEFVGHIYEFSENWDLLYIRLARVVLSDAW